MPAFRIVMQASWHPWAPLSADCWQPLQQGIFAASDICLAALLTVSLYSKDGFKKDTKNLVRSTFFSS